MSMKSGGSKEQIRKGPDFKTIGVMQPINMQDALKKKQEPLKWVQTKTGYLDHLDPKACHISSKPDPGAQ